MKRITKNAIITYAQQSKEWRLRYLLRQMAWNDFSISLKDLIVDDEVSPSEPPPLRSARKRPAKSQDKDNSRS
jgi:hypothetical protein